MRAAGAFNHSVITWGVCYKVCVGYFASYIRNSYRAFEVLSFLVSRLEESEDIKNSLVDRLYKSPYVLFILF